MENHKGTVTEKEMGETLACPAFAEAASRRQAKRFSGRRREDPASFTVSRYHPVSVSFQKHVGI